jgi:hypothetical protein
MHYMTKIVSGDWQLGAMVYNCADSYGRLVEESRNCSRCYVNLVGTSFPLAKLRNRGSQEQPVNTHSPLFTGKLILGLSNQPHLPQNSNQVPNRAIT